MAPSRGPAPSPPPKMVTEHPQELTASLKQVRKQHLGNLLAIMERCLASGDYGLTAGVCSLALASVDLDRYFKANIKDSADMQPAQLRISSVLWAVTEVLLNQQLPPEQVRRYLQQLLMHQPSHFSAEHMTNTAAMHMLLQGDGEAAHRMLSQAGRGRPSAQAPHAPYRAAVCAVIRHQQWLQLYHEVLQQRGLTPAAGSTASTWVYDRRVWALASSSHEMRDAWRECELQLKEALALDRSATLLSLLLVHAYVVSGRLQAAVDAAKAAAAAAPLDADAHMLCALMQQLAAGHLYELANDVETDRAREAGGIPQGQGPDGEAHPEVHAVQAACISALHADPLNTSALQVLLEQRAHCGLCQLAAAQGCMLYLDMEGVVLHLPRHDSAWQVLAEVVATFASRLEAAYHGVAGHAAGTQAHQDVDPQQQQGGGAANMVQGHDDQVDMAGQQARSSWAGAAAAAAGEQANRQGDAISQQAPGNEPQDASQQGTAHHAARDERGTRSPLLQDERNGGLPGGAGGAHDQEQAPTHVQHVQAARLWGQLRQELRDRASWWPVLQLSVHSVPCPDTGLQAHGAGTATGSGANEASPAGGSMQQGDSVQGTPLACAKLVVAAHMLGPLHAHSQQIADQASGIIDAAVYSMTTQAAHAMDNADGANGDSGMEREGSLWPQPVDREQLAALYARRPAWVTDVLAAATRTLTAEYHLLRAGRAAPGDAQERAPDLHAAGQLQQQQGERGGELAQGHAALSVEGVRARPQQMDNDGPAAERQGAGQPALRRGREEGVPEGSGGRALPPGWWRTFPMKRRPAPQPGP